MSVPLLGRFNTPAELFFSRVVSQLCEAELAIKHQLVAISAMQEQFSNKGNTRDAAALVATRHYGEALKRLADQSHVPPIQIMLVSCLLSVALESFRHDSNNLFLHLQSGLQILREWKGSQTPRHSDPDKIIEHYVEPIFAQLEATAAMTGAAGSRRGKQGKDLEWTRPQMPIAFNNFAETREKFHEVGYWLYIQNERHQLVRRGTPEFEDVNGLWNEWRRRFDAFKEKIPPGAEIEKLEARLLDVYYRTQHITFLCQSLPETEMGWDQYVDVFRECVRICHELNLRDDIYDPDPSRFSTSFCRDPGILPPCWQIAVNCRDPVVRHHALDLVRSHHRRCGDNDSCSAAAIAEVLMNLEEEGLDITTSANVPESHRVRPLEGDLTKPRKMVLTFTRSPYLVPEKVEVPLQIDFTPPVLPFKLFPLGASVRLAGYQGLVRPRTYACRCKSYGIR